MRRQRLSVVCTAFDAYSQGLLFRDLSDDVDAPEEHLFIVSWVEYCDKYEMGRALAAYRQCVLSLSYTAR